MAHIDPAEIPSAEEQLRQVESIRPIIEECAPGAEAERALPDEAYDAMLDSGLFRMLAPKAFGGFEFHPVQAYRVFEALARIDSAAGWNAQISSTFGGFASWLPQEGGEEVFERGPDTIFAGGFFPPGPSVKLADGWRVTARAAFASGCHRAQWLVVPILEVAEDASRFDPTREDAPAIAAFIPRDEVDLIDTWHTSGMRGTFSADISVDDVFVPENRIAYVNPNPKRAPAFSGPLYGTMFWPGIHGETTVSLGIAGAAIDKLLDLAMRKTPSFTRIPLRDREMAQHHVAKASALLDASRASLHASISEAYAEAEETGWYSEAAKRRCALAACFGAEACAKAVDLVHEAAGTSAIRIGQGFERHHRDIHVLTQHASKAYGRYEDVGKMLFDLEPAYFLLRI